jgi:hypothetical protein
MEVIKGDLVFDVDMKQVETIQWNVCECVGRYIKPPMPGSYYWNVLARWGTEGRHFVLDSGILPSKVEALTRARGRARFFKGEHHRAKC